MLGKKSITAFFISFALLLLIMPLRVSSAVFINEFLANGINDPESEWIELFNNGSFEISLSGWKISETLSRNFTLNASVPARGFIILAGDINFFNKTYPYAAQKAVIVNLTASGFNLADSSGEIDLYSPLGEVADQIRYAQASGKKFENVSVGRYPDGQPPIFNLSTLTPGSMNDNMPPAINKWIFPSSNNTNIISLAKVSVNITDDASEVDSVKLSIGGTNYSMIKSEGLWDFLWNTKLYGNGAYNLTLYFNDTYGKAGFEMLFNITVNNINSPAKITSAILINTDLMNRTNGTLMPSWSYNDSDNDNITAIETLWYVNNTFAAGYENKTFINPENTTRLENWTFSIRLLDGHDWSGFANSSTISISNSKPSIKINPSEIVIRETQAAIISLYAFDLDSEKLIFTFNDSRFFISNNELIWNTNLASSGNYVMNITVNDGIDSDSAVAGILVLDAGNPDNDGNPDFNDSDDDNDSIIDENDFLYGNILSIKTTIAPGELSITLNDSTNLSAFYNGSYAVRIEYNSSPFIEFNFTFSPSSILNLAGISINRTTNGFSAVSVGGLSLGNSLKSVYLEKVNKTSKSVCIKDSDSGFDGISSACDLADEILLLCDNLTYNNYSCINTGLRYKISGLHHSALKEQCRDYDGDKYGIGCSAGNDCDDNDSSKASDCSVKTASQPKAAGTEDHASSSAGGRIAACTSNWVCAEWSECTGGIKRRKCHDSAQCAFPLKKPDEQTACTENSFKQSVNLNNKETKSEKSPSDVIKDGNPKKTDYTGYGSISPITGNVVEAPLETNKKLNPGGLIIIIEVTIILGGYIFVKRKKSL